jgi:hypothetical protein
MTNAETVKRLLEIVDRAVREVTAILIAQGTSRPTPLTIERLRESIAKAIVDALDLGIWHERHGDESRPDVPHVDRDADTQPGVRHPPKKA